LLNCLDSARTPRTFFLESLLVRIRVGVRVRLHPWSRHDRLLPQVK
jgi:hypothetical protein